MRRAIKVIIGGAVLALASSTALAHDEVGFGLSIAVPGASGYVSSGPVYVVPPPVYYEPPPVTYYSPPPPVYYEAPAPVYEGPPPGVTVYYSPSYEGTDDGYYRHRDRDREDDDDD